MANKQQQQQQQMHQHRLKVTSGEMTGVVCQQYRSALKKLQRGQALR